MKQTYDVIIVGGGFTGCAAAIAAAREGCSVLLLEQAGALGGAAVNCLVNPFMWCSTVKDGERMELCRGIFLEICENLKKYGALRGGEFHEEYLKIVLDEMTEQAGVQVLFHAVLCESAVGNGRVDSVTVITKAGKLTFSADIFIDCTGDADLAVMCGCPYILGRQADNLCQPMTLCFRLANIDKAAFFTKEGMAKTQEIYRRWQEEGKTSNPRENVLVFRYIVDNIVHFNTTRVVKKNPVDPFDVSWAEREARKQMLELLTMLKTEHEACRNAELLSSAAWIGARESRMIEGEHILTEQELKDCTVFPDAVAAGNYDIDIHNPEGSGTSHYYFREGEYYTIPYRSLLPKGVNNLLVAGRCISSTHEAQASYRVMPIVCCLGEAAGTAASVAHKSGTDVKNADVGEIRRLLRKNGAFTG